MTKLAQAVLFQAYRDLNRKGWAKSAMRWFVRGCVLGESGLTVSQVLGIPHPHLVKIAKRVAKSPLGTYRPKGTEWLKEYIGDEQKRTEVP